MPYTSDGSSTWIFECWGGSNQQWEIAYAWLQIGGRDDFIWTPPAGSSRWIAHGTGRSYLNAMVTYTKDNELRLPDGRCLDVPWSTRPGTKVVAYPCHGGTNQKWYPQAGVGIFGLGGQCLTAPNGLYLEMQPCTQRSDQKFRFKGFIRGQANKCLTTWPDPKDWQPVYVRTCDWRKEQYWEIDLFDLAVDLWR